MNKDEINVQIAKIDRRLASENISIADRLDKVKSELFPDIHPDNIFDSLVLDSIETDRLINYLFEVDNWYKENYGDQIYPVSLKIKETPFFFQGEVWYFTHPEKVDKNSNLIEFTNFPKIIKQNLTEEEIEHLKDLYEQAKNKLYDINNLEDVVKYCDPRNPEKLRKIIDNVFDLPNETIDFLRFALEDLNLAIVTLKNTRDYQFVIFPASQAIEKLFKACIIAEPILKQLNQNSSVFYEQIESQTELIDTLRKHYGHKLFYILKDFNNIFPFPDKIKLEIDKFPKAKKMFKRSDINPRYHVIKFSAKEALEVIDATLNIFELVSDKFLKPLYRFMYYPQLEEGYDEYFSRLDDDYFDE
jgi:hypothetical protein